MKTSGIEIINYTVAVWSIGAHMTISVNCFSSSLELLLLFFFFGQTEWVNGECTVGVINGNID